MKKLILGISLLFLGCQEKQRPNLANTPELQKALQSIQVLDGFEVELVAAEPLVEDPVAMEIDEDGNWYVAEMPGYPLDLSKKGQIRKLIDTNDDGYPDKSIVFADSLTLPMGLMRWKKGILVADSPNILYFEDTDGDQKADKREVVLTGFSLSNPQHNMNTPKFGIDNWIYLGIRERSTRLRMKIFLGIKGKKSRSPTNPMPHFYLKMETAVMFGLNLIPIRSNRSRVKHNMGTRRILGDDGFTPTTRIIYSTRLSMRAMSMRTKTSSLQRRWRKFQTMAMPVKSIPFPRIQITNY